MLSIVASYVLNLILNTIMELVQFIINTLIAANYVISNNFQFISSILFAVLFAIILSHFYDKKALKCVMDIFTHKSINDNIWKDYIDFDEGTIMQVTYHNGNMYMGTFEYCEENELNSWFALKQYAICEHDGEAFSPSNNHPDARLIINFKDVERIELFYPDDRNIKEQT